MHKYIDTSKLRDFKKRKTYEMVEEDVRVKYGITNIEDDFEEEALYYICNALYEDYITQRANYEAYIEKGMNARMLMELRKSAVIPKAENLYDFYEMHHSCNNWQDVKGLRAEYFKFLNEDYADLNWQYYILVCTYLGYKAKDFYFDYEECYADGDPSKQTGPEDYKRDFVEAHTRKVV